MQESSFSADELQRSNNDQQRVYNILDALPVQPFEDVVQLAALICELPIAAVTLVDSQRIWRKFGIGLPQANALSRRDAFASRVVLNATAVFVVPDASQDVQFAQHPYVVGDMAVRFYAGAPIVAANGEVVGALGVMDKQPRTLSESQLGSLQCLARQVAAMIEVQQRSEREAGHVYRENQYLQALTLTGLDLQAVVDREYRYRHVNHVYLDYWQKSREQIEGKTVAELIGAVQFAECVKGYLDRAIAGEQIAVDASVTYPTLGERYVRTSFLPARDRLGNIIGAVIRVEDISDLKEKELSLRHTVHLLEEKKQDLQRFIYILSHDLREPVNTILNFSSLIREQYVTNDDDQIRRYLDFVYKGGDRMRSLLEDLLKYVRVDSNQPESIAVSLDELVLEVKQDLGAALQRTHAQVVCDALPTVQGDRHMLRVLIQNLLENAIKFVAPGTTPQVGISALREPDSWQITVTDNGVGIREEHREQVFELFKRLHSRKQYEGTGLGLATCRRIAELHGGRIWVTAAAAGGSCFHVSLPLRK